VAFLRSQGETLIDCQQETGHLATQGAVPIPRRDFLQHLRQAIDEPRIERWEVAPPLTT
jgi:leucyl/phenylalanyl-tRNA--protein transferase